MSRIDDETLAAYLDGELDAERARRVEEMVEHDPALKKRLAAWERSDRALRLALMEAGARLPEEAVATIMAATAEKSPSSSHTAAGGWRAWLARCLSGPALASAAAALVIGVVAGALLVGSGLRLGGSGGAESPSSAFLVAGGPLAKGLESVPSGGESVIADMGRRLALVATYRARDGRWCREFRLEPADGTGQPFGEAVPQHGRATALAGLACHEAGRWAVVALAPLPQTARLPGAIYRPAGDDTLPAELARQMRRLGLATPLDAESERRLLASGWSSPGS